MLLSLPIHKRLIYSSMVVPSLFCSHLMALDRTQAVTPSESLMPMLMGLVAILGVIFVLAFIFKKFSHFGLASKNIKVVETQVIGNKEKLMIVQVNHQNFLIGVTGHSINQLGELQPRREETASGPVAINIPAKKEPSEQQTTSTLPIVSSFSRIISQLTKNNTGIKNSALSSYKEKVS